MLALLPQTTETSSKPEMNDEPPTYEKDVGENGDEIKTNREGNTKEIIMNSPVILPILFSKLDFKTLNASRKVCRKWYAESSYEFHKRTKLVPRLDSSASDTSRKIKQRVKNRNLNNLKLELISFLEERHIQNLEIRDCDILFPKRYFVTLFRSIGKSLTSLSLTFGSVYKKHLGLSPTDVAQILFSCQNLNRFHLANVPSAVRMYSLKYLMDIIKWEISNTEPDKKCLVNYPLISIRSLRITEYFSRYDDYHSCTFFLELFEWMPQLERLELDVQNERQGSEIISTILRNCYTSKDFGYLDNLKELKLQTPNKINLCTNNIMELSQLQLQLTKLEIGYLDDWKTDECAQVYTGHQFDLILLLKTCKDTLKILRISSKFKFAESQVQFFCQEWRVPFPRMEKLKVLELDWDLMSDTNGTNFSNLPNWEKCKFLFPKCEYRKEDYFNKVEFKVRVSEGTASHDVLKILECKSPEHLVRDSLALSYGSQCTIVTRDSSKSKA